MNRGVARFLVRILAVMGGIGLTVLFLYLLIATVILSAMEEGMNGRDKAMVTLLFSGLVVGWGVSIALMFWLWDVID